MSDTYWIGDEQILYIKIEDKFYPVACITNLVFQEGSEVLETTTRDNEGWITALPTTQGYGLQFDGLAINSQYVIPRVKASYDTIKILKRNRTIFEWKLETNGIEYVDGGYGFFQQISQNSPAGGEFVNFSANIIGYGPPKLETSFRPVVTWDETTETFDSTLITFDSE